MISQELKARFEHIIEVEDIDWRVIDKIAQKDANILRPIKGVAFEEYLKKIIKEYDNTIPVEGGVGDSDVDLYVNGLSIQAKTIASTSTRINRKIGVSLHKTHGDETRPNNLYSADEPLFEYLCIQHPVKGVLIVPFAEIPLSKKWKNKLSDPARFDWDSKWLNRWDLIGINLPDDVDLDHRRIPQKSELPFLSSQTFLEDYEIIEMLCKPEYFRAAVMGLKGNLKEEMFCQFLKDSGLDISDDVPTYCAYDLIVHSKGENLRVQVKGTSKNMCSISKMKIGVEVMGTHGQFPQRGYKRSDIDYVAIIISKNQLPNHKDVGALNYIVVPASDLPLHYLVGNGDDSKLKGFGNGRWNMPQYSDIIYPQLKFNIIIRENDVLLVPDVNSYKKYKGYELLPINSEFRQQKVYKLNQLPAEWK